MGYISNIEIEGENTFTKLGPDGTAIGNNPAPIRFTQMGTSTQVTSAQATSLLETRKRKAKS